uniref:NAD(P)(+)--arginine ADP-ribosyltransferase n=1 Tax=Entomoneis paludosa TaxID=265537 RepID=A0A7S2Y629_9STRA|mmetsp:Transcript_19585/g.40614  ORF Transcript_19585/g.40614 Transcript_19585/m.40614 type:complete len:452 (+) Transcript_19585:2-1357(+)
MFSFTTTASNNTTMLKALPTLCKAATAAQPWRAAAGAARIRSPTAVAPCAAVGSSGESLVWTQPRSWLVTATTTQPLSPLLTPALLTTHPTSSSNITLWFQLQQEIREATTVVLSVQEEAELDRAYDRHLEMLCDKVFPELELATELRIAVQEHHGLVLKELMERAEKRQLNQAFDQHMDVLLGEVIPELERVTETRKVAQGQWKLVMQELMERADRVASDKAFNDHMNVLMDKVLPELERAMEIRQTAQVRHGFVLVELLETIVAKRWTLNEKDLELITQYTSGDFWNFNNALRPWTRKDFSPEELKKHLGRVERLKIALGKLQPRDGSRANVYRGCRSFPASMRHGLQEGATYQDPAFLSTSYAQEVAVDFARYEDKRDTRQSRPVFFCMNIKSGANVERNSKFDWEREILLYPNTMFRIYNVQKFARYYHPETKQLFRNATLVFMYEM